MFSKQLLIGVLATLLTFGLFGTAFASEFDGSEAGNWDYRFNSNVTDADVAAMNHDYNLEALVDVGTERGITEHRLDTSKADMAAKSHAYDTGNLAQIGTEAGIRDAASGVLCSRC